MRPILPITALTSLIIIAYLSAVNFYSPYGEVSLFSPDPESNRDSDQLLAGSLQTHTLSKLIWTPGLDEGWCRLPGVEPFHPALINATPAQRPLLCNATRPELTFINGTRLWYRGLAV